MDDLARLVEAEEIKRLKGRYSRAVDFGLWEEFASYLTEDFAFSDPIYGEFRGRDLIVERTRAAYEAMGGGWQHHPILPDIEITSATSATGVWTFGTGRYEDEYVKIDGSWKLKTSRVVHGPVPAESEA